MGLFIDEIVEHTDAKVIVSGLSDGGGPITGFAVDEFAIAGSAAYGSPFQNSMSQGVNDVANKVTTSVNAFAGVFGQSGPLPQIQMKNIVGSVVNWQSSPNLGLDVNFYFVAIRSGGSDQYSDVRLPARRLVAATFPTIEGDKKFLSLLIPPNKYKAGNINNVEGTLSLKIGKWFYAPKMFVLEAANFSFAKETTPDGLPLFARGSIRLQSYRILGADEIEQFLSHRG